MANTLAVALKAAAEFKCTWSQLRWVETPGYGASQRLGSVATDFASPDAATEKEGGRWRQVSLHMRGLFVADGTAPCRSGTTS